MKFGIKAIITITCAMFLFLGIVIGFLIAPIKKGIICGDNNTYGSDDGLWDEDWDEEDWRVQDEANDDIPF